MITTSGPPTNEPSRFGENCIAATFVKQGFYREPDNLTPQVAEASAPGGSNTVFAMLAHELRNPLACVTHAVQVLRAVGVREEAGQREWAVATIERHTKRLLWIVDDVLGVSEAINGQTALRSTLLDAATVIEDAQESVRALMETRGHTLTAYLPHGALWLFADAGRLEQVLVNLLTNAARYTEDGGRIALHAMREGAEVVIRVTDTGIGIAEENLVSLFKLFFRVEAARTRAGEGLGMGLTVVRHLVELHGGSVAAFSEGMGRGSSFIVRLPAAAPGRRAVYASPGVANKFSALRILIVDDNCDLAQGLSRLLRRHGHDVQCAHTGVAGLKLALAFQPEFVLVDALLPDICGYEIAALLPGVSNSTRLRIASISGHCGAEESGFSQAAGCIAHLQKPVNLAEIEALLAGHIAGMD